MLDWIGEGLRSQALPFPVMSGSIHWSEFSVTDLLKSIVPVFT
jgi:hypothetical protein